MVRIDIKKGDYQPYVKKGKGIVLYLIESELDADNYLCLQEYIETDNLENVKKWMINNIITPYDSSSSINSFSIKDTPFWLDKDTRAGLMLRFTAEKSSGKMDTSLWAGSVCIPLSLDDAFKMLYTLEMYASTCYDVTAKHKANVLDLDSINEVLTYDYKAGYPDKLKF